MMKLLDKSTAILVYILFVVLVTGCDAPGTKDVELNIVVPKRHVFRSNEPLILTVYVNDSVNKSVEVSPTSVGASEVVSLSVPEGEFSLSIAWFWQREGASLKIAESSETNYAPDTERISISAEQYQHNNDYDEDGVTNLLEYYREMNPTVNDVLPEMIAVPDTGVRGNCFDIGTDDPVVANGTTENTELKKRICLCNSYELSKKEITFGQYAAYLDSKGMQIPIEKIRDVSLYSDATVDSWNYNYPMVFVNYADVSDYADWLTSKDPETVGNRWEENEIIYRAPTEAEWEYAARAGETSEYWSGSVLSAGSVVDQSAEGFEVVGSGSGRTNSWGFEDIAGNVHEWVCSSSTNNLSSYDDDTAFSCNRDVTARHK